MRYLSGSFPWGLRTSIQALKSGNSLGKTELVVVGVCGYGRLHTSSIPWGSCPVLTTVTITHAITALAGLLPTFTMCISENKVELGCKMEVTWSRLMLACIHAR